MDIHLSTIGTTGNAGQDLQKQIKSLRESDQGKPFPGTLAGLRDDIARVLQQSGFENVQADVHISIDVKDLSPKKVLEGFVAGEPMPGRPLTESERGILAGSGAVVPVPGETTPSRRRASDAAPAVEPATPIPAVPSSTTKP